VLSEVFPTKGSAVGLVGAWMPIETGPTDKTLVLVALIRDGVIWRVSDAAFNGLGWYSKAGVACHWRTHWSPMPVIEHLEDVSREARPGRKVRKTGQKMRIAHRPDTL
jgi:hypothetical protein